MISISFEAEKYCTGFRCWNCHQSGRYTFILREQIGRDKEAHKNGLMAWYTDDKGKPLPCPVCGIAGAIEGEPYGWGTPGVYRSPESLKRNQMRGCKKQGE